MNADITKKLSILILLISGTVTCSRPSERQLQKRLRQEVGKEVMMGCFLRPCSLEGDFDGDGTKDHALLVRRLRDNKRGIAILPGNGAAEILGAGTEFGNGGDDFGWADHWSLYPKGPVNQGADPSTPPTLVGDGIYVKEPESASAIIYWDGKIYSWYQLGD